MVRNVSKLHLRRRAIDPIFDRASCSLQERVCVDAESQRPTRGAGAQPERQPLAVMLMKFKNQIAVLGRSSGGWHAFPIKESLVALGGIVLLMTMFVVQILSEGQRLTDYYTAMERSLESPARIWRVSVALQDAEIGQRGFLLTGRPEFLGRYERATRELSDSLRALEAVAGRPSLRPPLQRLVELVPAAVTELGRAITTYQQSGPAAATEIIAEGRGTGEVGEIRATIDEMLAIENRDMEALSVQIRAEAASSQAVLFILFGGILLAVLVSRVIGLAHIAAHKKTEADSREARQIAEAAQQGAEQANRAKSEFLTTMSHEIRTPLHAVIGTAEILLENGGLNLEQRQYLERIQVSGTALTNLVNDVLDLAKIEAGQVAMAPEPFSLETLIDNAVSIVRTTAQTKDLKLMVLLDHSFPPMLLGDESRLRQVLLNLLGNAVKFTDHGQVTLRVEHRGSTEAGEALRFSVTDTGPGIPKSEYERLFRRFSQISRSSGRSRGTGMRDGLVRLEERRSAGRSRGTGLGLTISKQLVALMGGEMGFESEEGRGSTFWFSVTLPQVEADIPVQPSVEHRDHQLCGPILVVDDLDQNRDLARKTLEAAGYAVDVASDGAQAVAAVQATRYELVLMDIQMDGMDGITATKAIRNLDHPAKDVPIVAMTANVFADDVKSFKAAGMNDHLGKPFKRKQLLEKVRRWLRSNPAANRLGAQSANFEKDPGAALDEKEIENLCLTMGRQWVIRGLFELKDQLKLTFEDVGVEPVDRDVLARQAHSLVARAGILGFSELARLCGVFEQACKRGKALGPPLSKARTAALQAQATIPQLLRTLNVHSPENHASSQT
jgi:signal transduction histidine kinase/CheY-like chemotaxis protein/HPt (histidine-containing phosphotransfer) domain-containing protein